jgi:hypothetical protein
MPAQRERQLDELITKQQVADGMARYARGIDRRDEELVRSVYFEDATDDHGYGFSGSGWDLATATRRDGTGFPVQWTATTHFLGQSYIEIVDGGALSETYFISYSRSDDDSGTPWDIVISGRYVDRWEHRDGDLKIAYRTVVYDRVRSDPAPTLWPGPDHDVPKALQGAPAMDTSTTTFGSPSTDDPSYALLHAHA